MPSTKFVIQPFKHSEWSLARKSTCQLMHACMNVVDGNTQTTPVNFTDTYRKSYKLVLHRHGNRVQSVLRHAIRALVTTYHGPANAELRNLRAVMLRDLNMYYQRTYVLSNKLSDVNTILAQEEQLYEQRYEQRYAWAVAVVDKYKQAWLAQYYAKEGKFVKQSGDAWCDSGLVCRKGAKRSRNDADGGDQKPKR